MAVEGLPAFFARNGLLSEDVERCLDLVRTLFPGCVFDHAVHQGGCSYTLKMKKLDHSSTTGDDPSFITAKGAFIVQFRPLKHAISVTVADEARQLFGSLVPTFRELGFVDITSTSKLQACQISNISGERFSDLQPVGTQLDIISVRRYVSLLEGLAKFYAIAWEAAKARGSDGRQNKCEGRVGSTMLLRLQKLEQHLPSSLLRGKARSIRQRVQQGGLDALPIVLTHGDLIPSNIMVDRGTWRVTGFVDWAEAEYLPFGLSFYCVDRVLGFVEQPSGACGPRFVWYKQEYDLRCAFWNMLTYRIAELQAHAIKNAVRLARSVAILLWHGIAFDDGKLDRVIDPIEDAEGLAYLNAFLGPTYEDIDSKL
ncbi:hypothetical protein LTR37_006026 [Vermiconidia calcicola]|uniref:Uncharacterized protein n=1 Tax=Vermiconidia calcicola TaxID=1690605 RepID=A0ACC3NIL1_9PEZI|nr:hypothetical protein LTR37_006026 [Vermiconidia calcicola]